MKRRIKLNDIKLTTGEYTLKLTTNIGEIVILKARFYPKQDDALGASSKDGTIIVKDGDIYFEWED